MELTVQHLRKIYPDVRLINARNFIFYYNRFKWLHKMAESDEIAQFLAQIGKETNQLLWTEELATGEDYEGREVLGNTQEGDGKRFKGRGYIQLTGRFNYATFTIWYNKKFAADEDFVKTPDKISEDLGLCMLASIFFWQTNKLNKPYNYRDCERSTKIVNGGYNGLNERIIYFERARQILN